MLILSTIACTKSAKLWLSVLVLLICLVPLKVFGRQPIAKSWPIVRRGALDTNNVNVTMIQYLLRSHGYFVPVDGRFGLKTERQVRRFQYSRKIQATGIVNAPTWKCLIIILHTKTRGEAVKAAQASLQQHTEDLSIDGHFGGHTYQAVRSFQRNNNLYADGVIDTATWLRLTDTVPD